MPGDNEIKFELDFGEPPDELLEYARKNIGENPETRCQVISEFRDLIYGKFKSYFKATTKYIIKIIKIYLIIIKNKLI